MEKLPLKDFFRIYERWVINNPTMVTDVETVATWSSYFVAGKINKSPVVSELVYSISKLVSLYNDKVIREAYGVQSPCYGLREQIKMCLTVLHYTEVSLELLVRSKWGSRGKWTAITMLQIFKSCCGLILLYRFKEVTISHPPIPSLHRQQFLEGRDREDEINNDYFTLKRSGRVVRRVHGSPPIALRDWQPANQPLNPPDLIYVKGLSKDMLFAETIHTLKPLIHLAAMKAFGTKSWAQFVVSLSADVISMRLFNTWRKEMSYDQRLEISRRKLSLALYLLRSPLYNKYSRNILENVLDSMRRKVPMMNFVSSPIIQYLNHWQDIYFYMWSS